MKILVGSCSSFIKLCSSSRKSFNGICCATAGHYLKLSSNHLISYLTLYIKTSDYYIQHGVYEINPL